MTNLEAIRQTVNQASITENDLIEAAKEIAEDHDGATITSGSIAACCEIDYDHPALTDAVLRAVMYHG